MKVKVSQEALLQLFERHKDIKGKQAKLKSPNQLQELLDITRDILHRMERKSEDASAVAAPGTDSSDEMREKFRIIRTVLEQGGQFSGGRCLLG
jgi:inositol hexakisphosphate/diphosphoinositol-pentakisphosphate kinase